MVGVNRSQKIPPGLELAAQRGKVYPVFHLSKHLQLPQALFKERSEARRVLPCVVVERGGNLDEAVKKILLVACRLQPHGLQGFVGLKEFPGIEKLDALFIEWFPHHYEPSLKLRAGRHTVRSCGS